MLGVLATEGTWESPQCKAKQTRNAKVVSGYTRDQYGLLTT